MINVSNETLAKVLALLGWRTEPVYVAGKFTGSHVYTDAGQHLGVMRAGEVWSLLRHRGLIQVEEGKS